MKSSYSYLFLVVGISFLISLNTIRIFTMEELSLFLTVVGLIYGLIAAFTINNAWERFSSIRDAISEETYALIQMYIYAKELSDKASIGHLKEGILSYCRDVPKIEWKDYWNSEDTHTKFGNIISIIARINVKTEKDGHLYDEITTDMGDAARSRNLQLVIAQTRISSIQWVLNIFLSVILIISLALVNIPNGTLSIFVTTLMVAAVLMILVVVYELDSMKMAEEEVSNAPYHKVVEIISKN